MTGHAKGPSKRGPKCRCIDCALMRFETDGEDYSWWSWNFCGDQTETSWAWKKPGYDSGDINETEAVTIHRCPLFQQKHCRHCDKKIKHANQLMSDDLCTGCENRVMDRMIRQDLPRRLKKPDRFTRQTWQKIGRVVS